MNPENRRKLAHRVTMAAQAALRARGYAAPIDVLLAIGWLDAEAHARWRGGQIPYLERVVQANLSRISTAMHLFRQWAANQGLKPSETHYRHKSHTLRFSKSGNPSVERLYRTHWVSPTLSQMKRKRRQGEARAERTAETKGEERENAPPGGGAAP
jgi:hypothetical protein